MNTRYIVVVGDSLHVLPSEEPMVTIRNDGHTWDVVAPNGHSWSDVDYVGILSVDRFNEGVNAAGAALISKPVFIKGGSKSTGELINRWILRTLGPAEEPGEGDK